MTENSKKKKTSKKSIIYDSLIIYLLKYYEMQYFAHTTTWLGTLWYQSDAGAMHLLNEWTQREVEMLQLDKN